MMAKFIKKRKAHKENLKDNKLKEYYNHLGFLEKQIKQRQNVKSGKDMYPTEKELKREFEKGMYELLSQIETTHMEKECKDINQNESILLFTNNEFERQFQHLMNDVEKPVFKH